MLAHKGSMIIVCNAVTIGSRQQGTAILAINSQVSDGQMSISTATHTLCKDDTVEPVYSGHPQDP